MNQKNLLLEVEGSNGILGSLQLCKTNIVSQRGFTHDSYHICLLLECECNGGRGTNALPLMLSSEQAAVLRAQLGQMIKLLDLAESGHEPQSFDEIEPFGY